MDVDLEFGLDSRKRRRERERERGRERKDRDQYLLNMYVLLSRGTCQDNLLLFRRPPKAIFDEGPPQYLRDFLCRLGEQGGHLQQTGAKAIRQRRGSSKTAETTHAEV